MFLWYPFHMAYVCLMPGVCQAHTRHMRGISQAVPSLCGVQAKHASIYQAHVLEVVWVQFHLVGYVLDFVRCRLDMIGYGARTFMLCRGVIETKRPELAKLAVSA